MSRSKTLFAVLSSLLLLFCVHRLPAQDGDNETAAASRQIAAYFPQQTVGMVVIPDAADLKNKLMDHRLAEAIENEQIRAFFRPLLKKKRFKKMDDRVREVTGRSLDELTNMLTGSVAAGFLEGKDGLFVESGEAESDGSGNVHVLLIGKVGDNVTELENNVIPSVIKKAKKKMREKRDAELFEKTEPMGDITLHTLLKRKEGETENLVRWAFVNDHLAIVSPRSETLLENTVRKIQGDKQGGTVTKNKNYGRAIQKTKNAELYAFADVGRIVEAGYEKARESGGDNQQGPSGAEVMDALGLETFQSAVATVNLEKEFTEANVELMYSGRKGLTRMIALQSLSRDRSELLSLPAAAVTASATGVAINQFWEQAMSTFKELSPRMSAMLNMQIQNLKKKYGIDLKKDLVDSLGNRIVVANFPPADDGTASEKQEPRPRQMWAIQVRDKQRLTGAINSLKNSIEKGNEYFSEREYLGTTIYSVKPELLPGQSGGKQGPTYAFVDGYVLISGDEKTIEDTIAHGRRDDRKGFFEQDQVRTALDRLPSESVSISYTNVKSVTSFILNQFKSGVGRAIQQQAPGGKEIQEYVDLDADLDPETVGQFVQSVVASVHMNDRRLRMIWRMQHEE